MTDWTASVNTIVVEERVVVDISGRVGPAIAAAAHLGGEVASEEGEPMKVKLTKLLLFTRLPSVKSELSLLVVVAAVDLWSPSWTVTR